MRMGLGGHGERIYTYRCLYMRICLVTSLYRCVYVPIYAECVFARTASLSVLDLGRVA
jgi:hypothetical protein